MEKRLWQWAAGGLRMQEGTRLLRGVCVKRKGTGWAAISRVREAGMRRTSLGLRLKGAKVKRLLYVSWQPSRIDPLQGDV